jgi:primase-polymerase (primpol)-like protein
MGRKCDLQSSSHSTVVDASAIPVSLRKLNQWICWRLEGGKKIPYGGEKYERRINFLDKRFWLSSDVALSEHQKYRCSGIGFVLDGSGIIGIDLDNCVKEGIINPEALSLLDGIGADYVEFSPSGSGLRSFVFGALDNLLKGTYRGVQYEIYAEKRYLTVTGNKFRGNDLASVFDLFAITPPPLLLFLQHPQSLQYLL